MALSEITLNAINSLQDRLKADPQKYRLSQLAKQLNLKVESLILVSEYIGITPMYNPNYLYGANETQAILEYLLENTHKFEDITEEGEALSFIIRRNESWSLIEAIEDALKYNKFRRFREYKIFNSEKTLYRYSPFNDHTIDALENYYIYHSTADKFNDPYDCWVINLKRYIKNEASKVTQKFQNQINSFIEHTGLACFSQINNSILMWSHYAKNHTGICIEYHTNRIYEQKKLQKGKYVSTVDQIIASENKGLFSTLFKIKYVKTWEKGEREAKIYGRWAIKDIYLRKYLIWKYEKEVRGIIYLDDPGIDNSKKCVHKPNAIKAIYLGVNASKTTVERVKNIIEKYYDNKVELYKAKLNNDSFQVEFELECKA